MLSMGVSVDVARTVEEVKNIGEILGLLVGGLWTYYTFFKGRTFRPRLELQVGGDVQYRERSTLLTAYIQIKNVGLSKLQLCQRGSALRIFSSLLDEASQDALEVGWERVWTLPVFEKHRWIEPGETINDQMLVLIPDHPVALKLALRIVSNRIEWNAVSIVKQTLSGGKNA